MLQVEGLCFGYPQRALFTDWSARIPPGVSLVRGGDGSGKTTLLRLLAGALPNQGGQLRLNGASLRAQPGAYRQQVFWADPRSDAFEQITPADYLKSLRPLYPGLDELRWGELIKGLVAGAAPGQAALHAVHGLKTQSLAGWRLRVGRSGDVAGRALCRARQGLDWLCAGNPARRGAAPGARLGARPLRGAGDVPLAHIMDLAD
ncbi:ATP-binding cassette domain-containing protein [Rhodoferax sp.]|uniref:ABC transporter ATP-binding protein n=1 Tax=Rhodoferax sp. TaxID=50421 RepID=UPI0025D9EE47|nr:ATP-binding cassette domain-containing protein [Rhodoferax sp.]